MDGYPKTESQLESLGVLNINPTLIVIIDANDDLIERRLTQRRTDPVSGVVYKNIDEVPNDARSRVLVAPNEKREVV